MARTTVQHVTVQDMGMSEVKKQMEEFSNVLHNIVGNDNCVAGDEEFYNFINDDLSLMQCKMMSISCSQI